MKEFVIQQLTGHEVVDYSVASATGLFHQNRLTWSMAALNWIGLSEERLFQPVSSHTILHTTKQSIVPDVPWIIGASDGCLAHWGSGANKNDISFTLGTSGAVRRFNPQNKIVGSGEVFSYKLDEHVTISGGASNCGTAIIDWYAKNMRQTSSSVQSLVDEIKTIPAGVDGLVALPMLMGERAPVYNSNARGVFFGVSMQQTHLHFQRALFEGICYEMKSIVEAVESNLGPSDKIIISGGFTHSPYWMQMMSDVLNRTLTLTDERDASSLGAAKFGFESLGLKWEKETAYHEQIHPQASHVNIYHANYQLFRTLYEQLEVLFTPPQFP